jgi:LssY C-terminus
MRALLLLALVAASGEQEQTLPAGTVLSIRLTSAVASHSARVGDPLGAVLDAPARLARAPLVPAGWTVRGKVAAVGQAGPHDHRSMLELNFTELVDESGRATLVSAKLVGVDNARETLDEAGRILSLPPHHARPNKVDELLLLAAHLHPIMLGVVEPALLAERKMTEAPIAYTSGVEMTLALAAPASVLAPTVLEPTPSAEEQAEIEALVARQPLRAVAAKNGQPSDLTNVLFAGSAERVARAFVAAGWTAALPGGVKADSKAFLALAERHGYKPAPVSLLTLEGQRPALVFEKQNNTLARRHHVRIWARPGEFRGRPIFLAAATQDVGIFFSAQERTFTHRIESRIDLERDKIVDDLAFAGAVKLSTVVDRPRVSRSGTNAAGDRIETDGAIAALVLR